MEKSKKHLDQKKRSYFIRSNYQLFILFSLIIITCIFFDFYYRNNSLLVPFILTTLISSTITFLSISKLKEIKIKQIIREEGPKNHFIKQGTPTMGGIFFIPVGIIIANIFYFN